MPISNENIIPSNIPISTEEYVVGIIMQCMENKNEKNLAIIFSKNNEVNSKLSRYLLIMLVINFLLGGFIFLLNFLLTQYFHPLFRTLTSNNNIDYGQFTYCSVLNIAANLT